MKFFREFRSEEVWVMAYRLLLVYFFYQAARLLFWFYNKDLIKVDSLSEYLNIAYRGIAFDTTAILYVNALFILLSLLPLVINTKGFYQKMLFWVYFVTNGIAYGMNFGDFIYYRFSQARLTTAAMHVAQHETNLMKVFVVSVLQHPSVLILFALLMTLWVWLYRKVRIEMRKPVRLIPYFLLSVIVLCATAVLAVGGIRGDFRHSTRPINLVDANRHVKNPVQANLVLNSVFSFFRTLGSNNFELVKFVDDDFIQKNVHPYKQYSRTVTDRPNIVILIVESFGREYSGAFNRHKDIKDYVSYTPFIDSLATESLIFPNSYANGRQSIHGMSSILAGIPSLTDAFTSSPYSNQKIQSIVSVCNELGYDSSFYHGAPNGSMGFQGFAGILGFKDYFGKNEYNNDADFDGMWAIWDEPFLQYFANNTGKTQPFMSTAFTASSHHPFTVPDKYQDKFRPGTVEMHIPMQYTDMALKKYFDTVKKKPWFKNTIFVITGDHPNKVNFPEYDKMMNRFAVPILFYSPNPEYNLKGVNMELAQQMDIYPTLADLIGYNKKIRSWGRSLVSEQKFEPFIINSDAVNNQIITRDYIYRFNGKEVEGIYNPDDLNMDLNLKGKVNNRKSAAGEKLVKAWYQDYMDRVINRKLN